MDSTIIAAWISGGVGTVGVLSTAITAWIGARNTRKATVRTIEAGAAANRATLLAAHDAWLREKRAEMYEDAISALLQRKEQRLDGFRVSHHSHHLEVEGGHRLMEFLEGHHLGAVELQARIAAYSSDGVLEAYTEVLRAQAKVKECYLAWKSAAGEAATLAPYALTIREASEALDDALESAEREDTSLINVIRYELRSESEGVFSHQVRRLGRLSERQGGIDLHGEQALSRSW